MLRYTDIVLEHFRNPRNVGVIEDPDGYAIEGSPACGDQIVVYIKVDPNTKVITDIKFQSFGCASNIATGSMMTEMVKGKTIEEALRLTWKDVADALGGLPPVKLHCSVLAIDGLKAAIRNYLGEKTKGKLSKEEVVNVLSSVLYPSLAVDIVTLKLLNFLKITEKGEVIVELLLGEEDPFKEHIKEEIVEKVSKINGVKKVEVNFVK